jgi:hypothetical protein
MVVIPGNHDVGYGANVNEEVMVRFEKEFGPANEIFEEEGITFVVMNSQTLDASYDKKIQQDSWDLVDRASEYVRLRNRTNDPVVLITHIPLHKESGHCVDEPFTSYD